MKQKLSDEYQAGVNLGYISQEAAEREQFPTRPSSRSPSPATPVTTKPVSSIVTINEREISITHTELTRLEFTPVTWGVFELVPQGVTLMASKPKIGKSWLALQMCYAKAAGAPLWDGRKAEKVGGSLYLALEDNMRRLKNRSERSFPQHLREGEWKAKCLGNLHFATEWPRMGSGGLRQLDEWLRQHPDCDLVVIDTLARFRPATSGHKAYEDDYRVGEALKRVSDKHAVAILVIHHTRKMEADDPFDTISGTQGLTGSVDASMVLTRLRGRTDAGLFVTGRDIETEIEIALEFDKVECRWLSTGISVQEAKLDTSRQEILDAVRQADKALTIKGIRAQLIENGITKALSTVAKAVGRMVTDGQLEKDDSNTYTTPIPLSELSE